MKTRNGKIAQLPKPIRDDLNHRLENGKQSPELLEWLNSLPETQELITQKFDNQPITRSNLSDWRQGGFAEWRADQIREARIQRICETGGSLEQAEAGDLFENFARITVAEMMVDMDALQKLRGEKRAEHMRNLVRDLARLQNAYNRSRWADLAWTKYNDTNSATVDSPERSSAPDPRPSTLSPPPPVVPDRVESQVGDPNDPEPKPNQNGMDVLHFTNCNCDDPCPKCHAPESAYPLDEAIRDRRYYKKHSRNPCDRHGKSKFLINVACDCACDRCADKTGVRPSPAAATYPIEPPSNLPPLTSENRCARDGRTPESNPSSPLDPINPTPSIQVTDFSRRLALLKTAT